MNIELQISDDICEDLYGFKFQDGSKQRSRGSVEQLKHAQKQVAAYEHTKTQEVNERLLIYGETRKKAIDTALVTSSSIMFGSTQSSGSAWMEYSPVA